VSGASSRPWPDRRIRRGPRGAYNENRSAPPSWECLNQSRDLSRLPRLAVGLAVDRKGADMLVIASAPVLPVLSLSKGLP